MVTGRAARRSSELAGRADPDAVDRRAPGSGEDELYGVGDVVGVQQLEVDGEDRVLDRLTVVAEQLRVDAARCDTVDSDVPRREFLPERLGEPVEAELRQGVDAVDGIGLVTGAGADIDQVGHPSRLLFGGGEQVLRGRPGDVQLAPDLDPP